MSGYQGAGVHSSPTDSDPQQAGSLRRVVAVAARLTWRAAALPASANAALMLAVAVVPIAIAWLTKLVVDGSQWHPDWAQPAWRRQCCHSSDNTCAQKSTGRSR